MRFRFIQDFFLWLRLQPISGRLPAIPGLPASSGTLKNLDGAPMPFTPANVPAEEFVTKTRGLVSRFFELPLAQRLVNYSLRKALGLPAPAPVLIVMLETEARDQLTELLTDPTIKSLAEEFLREFGDVDYEVCSADIVLNAKKPVA
ncbi:hypothetical protein B0H13DRAFT_2339545 [Mycena leptocephala]|nr:hypothetical protein B0H13DRAFT_2339545 [Mycena leptocephala]